MKVSHNMLSDLVYEFNLDTNGLSHALLLEHLKRSKIPIVDLQCMEDSVALFLSEPVSPLRLQESILNFSSSLKSQNRSREVEIPVCYENEYAPDLYSICDVLQMEPDQVIKLHQSSSYTVAMFGFVPGFAYLDGLPRSLYVNRKATPVKKLNSGSVAIATRYSAIYPVDAPGGWHVIGRTPLKIVSWLSKDPFLIGAEDSIRFVSISSQEFQNYVN